MSNASDFIIENGVLKKYIGSGGDVAIPEGIRGIGDKAFCNCSSLVSIIIPNSVTEIGNEAFSYCIKLTSVIIPESVKRIKKEAFLGCKALASVTVSDISSWCHITFADKPFHLAHSYDLFIGNMLVIDLTIPVGVTIIRNYAFHNCNSIENVMIPESVTDIGESAFEDCSHLKSVKIPESVSSIGKSAFSYCYSLKDIIIPNSVTRINEGLFYRCSGLTNIIIPNSVMRINDFAFLKCSSLNSITIPDSVTEIGKKPFDDRTHVLIGDISKLPADVRKVKAIHFLADGGLQSDPGYDSCCKYIKTNATKLVDKIVVNPTHLSVMCREKLITPGNVGLYIEAAQKTGNPELIAIMLDYQSNKISAKQKEDIEKRREKEQETIASRVMARQAKDGIEGLNIAVTGKLETFDNRNELKAYILKNGGKMASSLTANVDYLILNDSNNDSIKAQKTKDLGIEIITERQFNKIAGRDFVMKGTVLDKYYGPDVDVVIPEGVTSIGDSAFYHCVLSSVIIPDGVTKIEKWAFCGCENLKSVMIPGSVTSIETHAFACCKKLESVTIPEGITSICDSAFCFCNFTNIIIPENVKYIENGAFEFCKNLIHITIPESVTSIGDSAFCGCSSLLSIKLPDVVTRINKETFRECSSLTSMVIPINVTSIGGGAFLDCDNLTSITLPEKLTSIDEQAFRYCSTLKKMTIPANLQYIGEKAFSDCPNLVINVTAGTYAEQYAKENNIPFAVE